MSDDVFKSADWAREALAKEEAQRRVPAFIIDNDALQAMLADPKVMREFARPDGIIVVDGPDAIPDAATLANARSAFLDANGELWWIGQWGSKPVKLNGSP